MIRRHASLAALAFASLFFGCAAPADDPEIVQETNAAATAECDPFSEFCDPTTISTSSAFAFKLSGFDSGTLVVQGTNAKGQVLKAKIATTTLFRSAVLEAYPTDPIYPVDPIRVYNDAVTSGDAHAVYSALTSLTGYSARVWINKKTNTVRAFRPVP